MIDYKPRLRPDGPDPDINTPMPNGMQPAPAEVMRPAQNNIRQLLQRLNGGGMQKPFVPKYVPQEIRDRLQMPQQMEHAPQPAPQPPLRSVLRPER
jgi:hypothetical protein